MYTDRDVELLKATAERATRYLSGLDDRPVAATRPSVEQLQRFAKALPEGGTDPEAVIASLDELGSPATMAMAGPRFFGFVIGGALPVSVAANWLATAWDQNTGLFEVTPATAYLEEVALGWLVDLFGLPAGTGGAFVTGASVANLSALAAARHVVLERAGWDVEARGLFGAPEVTVVISAEQHPTVIKALGVLGFGRTRVIRVPVDAQGRMRADALPRVDAPLIVCTQVGNVNTGACDPVDAICDYAAERGGWVHVDGAFGLWAAASARHRHLVSGIGRADSWATDAHKWLNVPYDSGIAFVRVPDALRASMAITAEYLPTESPRRNPSDYTPELSRRARGVDVWAALQHLGRSGVADMIDRCCRHAQRFASELRRAGLEVLNEVVLNQVLVACESPAQTRELIAAIQADGTLWCGGTEWRGKAAMRISLSSWATTDADVDRCVAAIVRLAAETGSLRRSVRSGRLAAEGRGCLRLNGVSPRPDREC